MLITIKLGDYYRNCQITAANPFDPLNFGFSGGFPTAANGVESGAR